MQNRPDVETSANVTVSRREWVEPDFIEMDLRTAYGAHGGAVKDAGSAG